MKISKEDIVVIKWFKMYPFQVSNQLCVAILPEFLPESVCETRTHASVFSKFFFIYIQSQ
jgi:hypothetical protein